MGKVILIAGIVFIALAVIEIIWFILRGITSGINQCHEWEENPDKKESKEREHEAQESEVENEDSKHFEFKGRSSQDLYSGKYGL